MTYLFSNTSSIFQSNGTAITEVNPLPVTLGSANINIIGNITIPTTINVASSPDNPVHTHITEVGTTGNLQVPYLPIDGNVVVTSGNIIITSLPNINATVVNSITVSSITSNVNVNPITGNVGIIGNVNVTQGTTPWVVTGNVGITGTANVVLADDANVIISGFSGSTADAFGRLRVSNPFTLFDTQALYYDHNQFASNITGTANVIYEANSSTFMCNVGTQTGDSVLRETYKPFPYQPGKSLLILHTFCMNDPKTNLRQRAGFFDLHNGVYFEVDGTTLNMVIRSRSSGVIVETRIPQSQWNGDTLLGSGGSSNPSGFDLDPGLAQIWWCDIEWLGVGSVRVGFIIRGIYITCHTFHHANEPGNTTTYMSTATLPLRYEITNTGETASTSMLRQICSSVISEGGYQLAGNPRAAAHVLGQPVRLPNDASFKPVISIRLKNTALDAVVVPINYSIIPLAASVFHYRVYKKAISSGGTWTSSANDSSVEYNLAPTSLVSGDIVEQSFINSTNQSTAAPTQEEFSFIIQLEREPFTGVTYEYLITVATVGTNQDIYASIEWQEVT